ncbi:MAG: DUF4147 domain-containing protein [Candidatus Doudnabacteria bacterium]|nr:DUF4147 domain-containing protein [Candidatus Doudnabacteria bacterium]
MSKWIKNFDQLAISKLRQDILAIAEAGLAAIDTEKVIKANVSIKDQKLKIKDLSFDLSQFKNLKVIGFGKASCKAALVLEQILGSKIQAGTALGVAPVACEIIQTYGGTHPQPSNHNVEISEQIMKLAQNATADDLVIVVVSGGGSALLCYPQNECDQGQILYHQFLKVGGTIEELNTVRKHISQLKGGGLAKALYPATVISLIFSDVPGDNYNQVASGPTYKDQTTIADAQKIIAQYNLGKFELNETPKEDKYFANVHNIPLVTNQQALEAMQGQTLKLGYKAKILTNQAYETTEVALNYMFMHQKPNTVLLVGGEPKMRVVASGSGGRNLYASLLALQKINSNQAFLSLASDGLDNSDAAGAIADEVSLDLAKAQNSNIAEYTKSLDSYNFFKKINQLITTGPTEANVSDLLILLNQ